MAKDIHKSAFEESTLVKLAIFRDYLKEWLPVFLAARTVYWKKVNVFDFFAGPGKDSTGNNGSPLIIVEELLPHLDLAVSKNLVVSLHFNENDKQKYDELSARILSPEFAPGQYNKIVENLDFKVAFDNWYSKMNDRDTANLLFLDQYGVKHITEDVFKQIIGLKRTDFLFFISSSTIKRFADHPSIQAYFKLDKSEIENIPYHQIHRYMLNYYKSLIPADKQYYLSSFSLRKGSNIYGLIFGSGHPLGMEKFLGTCWNIDPERGEANFDIDNEKINHQQYDLFADGDGIRKPNKVEVFEQDLETHFRNKDFKTTKDIYLYVLSNGFLPRHAKSVIKKMIDNNVIARETYSLSNKLCKPNVLIPTIQYC